MANLTKTSAHVAANILPLYRAYRGFKTAERLRTDMQAPASRSWRFAGRVALDISTDIVDGKLARYAGSTRLGGYLDQLADKAWFLQITKQLVENGELHARHLKLPAARDLGTLLIRPVAQLCGLQTDANSVGKLKMLMQTEAVMSACSPLAVTHPEFVQGLFVAATMASMGSGAEMLIGYAHEIADQYKHEPMAQFITAAAAYAVPILQTA